MNDCDSEEWTALGGPRRTLRTAGVWTAATSVAASCLIGMLAHVPSRRLGGSERAAATATAAAAAVAGFSASRSPLEATQATATQARPPGKHRAVKQAHSGRSPIAAAIAVRDAFAQLGKPYVYGGTGPRGFDCSGLTQHAWRAAGVFLPPTSH